MAFQHSNPYFIYSNNQIPAELPEDRSSRPSGPVRTQPRKHTASTRNRSTPLTPRSKKPEDLSKPDPTDPVPWLRAKFGPLKFRYVDHCLHEMHSPEYKHWIKLSFPLGMAGADFNLAFEPGTGNIMRISFVSRSIAFHPIDKWKDDYARRVNDLDDLESLFAGLIAYHNETMHRGQIRLMTKAAWPEFTDIPLRTNEESFLTPPIDPLRNGKGNKCKRAAVPLSFQTMPSIDGRDEQAYLNLCARRGALIFKPAFWQPDLSVNQLTTDFKVTNGTSDFVVSWKIELEGDGEIKRDVSIKVNKHCLINKTCRCPEHFEQAESMKTRFREVREEQGIFRAVEQMVEIL